jgi:cardiolipin synthase (CMP-forming)
VAAGEVSNRIWTVPNMLSFLRLAMVPLFLWLILGPQMDVLALLLLMASGATDWLDGKIARATGQITKLGTLLDPLADRLFIIATLIGLLLRDIVPIWLVVLLLSRDLMLAGLLPALRRRGLNALPVHFLGKAATMNLLYALPLLLLADGTGLLATVAFPVGWAFALWGVALYWYAGVLYVLQARLIVTASPR